MGFKVNDGSKDLFEGLVVARAENRTLEELDRIVDWKRVRALLATAYSASGEGKLGYDPVVLAKMLLLETIYNLSDVRVSRECADRLSFRAFLGLELKDTVPDDSTLVRFRDRLREKKLLEKLESLITEMIREQGVSVRGGSMIDATLIPAATRPRGPKKEDDGCSAQEEPKGGEGGAPAEDKRAYREREAGYTVKRGHCIYGWKLHAARDAESGIVKSFEVTRASVHDSQVFEVLIGEGEPAVLADKAYCSAKNRQFLRDHGIADGIMKKAKRGDPGFLRDLYKEFNRGLSRLRAPVENSFANLKRWRGLGRARYLGVEKMMEQARWAILAHNLLITIK